MPALFEKLSPSQAPFENVAQVGDYVTSYPLGAAEPSALLLSAPFTQYRANYVRPAATSNIAYAANVTAYFVDDVGFTDTRAGLTTWQRQWATVPASWSEPGGSYAYAFPAFTAVASLGNSANVTAVSTANGNHILLANVASGTFAGDSLYIDLDYARGAQNYHVTFSATALAVSVGVSATIPAMLPGSGTFTVNSGTLRKGNFGRGTPETAEVDSFLLHDYAFSSIENLDTDLPQVQPFDPVTSGVPYSTQYLLSTTLPTAATYQNMVAAGALIVATPSERRRYMGNIFERTTRLVVAS